MKDAGPMLKELSRKQKQPTSPWPERFVLSAGGILALVGVSRILEGLEGYPVLDLPEPLLGVPFRYLLLACGVVELVVGWLCLSANNRTLGLGLVAWLAFNSVAYRAGLWSMGWPHPWVFVGDLTDLLNVSPVVADTLLLSLAGYLLAGSAILLLRPASKVAVLPEPGQHYSKTSCPGCGGKTAFTVQWAGQTIACPHCGGPLSLPGGADGKHA
jgi:ribosomal protein S27E